MIEALTLGPACAGGSPEGRLERLTDEISLLEDRLLRIGIDGDCAYERAMGRFYDGLLRQRRDELAAEERLRGRRT